MSLQNLLASLFGAPEPDDGPMDTRLAAVALLVHMMMVDGEVTPAEKETLNSLVRRHFSASAREAERLIARAREADAEAVDLYGFTRILKNELPEEERIRLVEHLWDMVYADGDVHEFEDNLVWRISELLAVDPKDRIAMKQKVRGEQLMENARGRGGDEE